MRAEIISIGSELLLGEIVDTDSSYLAGQLPALGIDLYWISQVGDNKARLEEVLGRAWQRSELILTSGGLGPTADDLTRETIAEVLNEKLAVDPSLEKGLRQWFARWNLEMPLSNLKQAALIPSARPIPNARGTAPGWWVEKNGRILVALPGPPGELQEMWLKKVKPKLQKSSKTGAVIILRTLKTFGVGEATVGELVSPLLSSANPTLAVYAKADGIHLRIAAKARTRKQAEEMIAEAEVGIRGVLGEHIWGVDDETLETVAASLLVEKGLSLAVMEDYSGGQLAASLRGVPTSRTFFKGGVIASSDEAKIAFGVSATTISKHGAASSEVAREMAGAVRKLLKADIGLSVTAKEKAEDETTGAVYIGITDETGGRATLRLTRRRVVPTALFELRKSLVSF